MWKWLKETILAIVVVVLTTAGAAAAAPSLSDGAHLLTPAEQAEVTAVLQYTEARYGVRVAVVTVASTKGVKAGTYANQLLDRDYKDGQNGNMVLLLAMVVALVLAVGGGVAFRAYLISRMSNVRQAAAADAYVDAGSFHLTDSSDTFVFMTVQHIAKARPADDDLPDFDSDADCSDDDHGGGGGSF
jgi:flagellar basal body-associated protein FliL